MNVCMSVAILAQAIASPSTPSSATMAQKRKLLDWKAAEATAAAEAAVKQQEEWEAWKVKKEEEWEAWK
eukprot:11213765-Heterocapsa_arctica.AAC.1